MPTFEEILAEAEATIARQKARGRPSSRAPIEREDDPAKAIAYVPVRNVYLYGVTTCTCGHRWDDLEGIYEDRQHKNLKHSHWVRLPSRPTTALPKAVEYRHSIVPYCKVCADAPPKETESQPEAPRIAAA